MIRTWLIEEGATFLQDKVSVTDFHVHLWESYFSIQALLAPVLFHVSHPLALCSIEGFYCTMNCS